MCILFVYTLLKVVSYYDMSVLWVSKESLDGGVWVGWALSKFILDFWNFFNFARPLSGFIFWLHHCYSPLFPSCHEAENSKILFHPRTSKIIRSSWNSHDSSTFTHWLLNANYRSLGWILSVLLRFPCRPNRIEYSKFIDNDALTDRDDDIFALTLFQGPCRLWSINCRDHTTTEHLTPEVSSWNYCTLHAKPFWHTASFYETYSWRKQQRGITANPITLT